MIESSVGNEAFEPRIVSSPTEIFMGAGGFDFYGVCLTLLKNVIYPSAFLIYAHAAEQNFPTPGHHIIFIKHLIKLLNFIFWSILNIFLLVTFFT